MLFKIFSLTTTTDQLDLLKYSILALEKRGLNENLPSSITVHLVYKFDGVAPSFGNIPASSKPTDGRKIRSFSLPNYD